MNTGFVAGYDLEALGKSHPLNRVANPEEIAQLIAFVAGDPGANMTACEIFSDGGLNAASPKLV